MELIQLLEAVNTPGMLEQLIDHTLGALPAEGLNMQGDNPLFPDKPISDIPHFSLW